MLDTADFTTLVLNGTGVVPIHNALVQSALQTHIPWTDSTLRAVTIRKAVFAPEGNKAFVNITGSISAPDLIIKGVRAPIEIGFVLRVGGQPRLESKTGELYLAVTDVEITDFNPAEGFGLVGDLGMSVLGLGGRTVMATGRAVGRGTGALLRRIPKPRIPQFLRKNKDKVESLPVVLSGQEQAVVKAGGVSKVGDSIKEKLQGWILAAVNSYLVQTPIYKLPSEVKGIAIGEVVQDVRVADGQIMVQVDLIKSPQVRSWRRYLWWGVVGAAVLLVSFGILLGIVFE